MSVDDKSTYATGKPLEQQSKEGFWGHMNPLARKKWVKRQVDPIKDRTNELDQLQAKNANDIKDVDSARRQASTRRRARPNWPISTPQMLRTVQTLLSRQQATPALVHRL